MPQMMWPATAFAPISGRLESIGAHTAFFLGVVAKASTPPYYLPAWIDATAILVRRCLPPLLVALLTLGAVMAVQGLSLGTMVRADSLVGALMGSFTFREIGPVVTAVLIGAQGGSFVATELGAMRVKEEFDALELIAVDPVRYAVVPRFMGFLIATPILCMMADACGLIGGLLSITLLGDITSGTFWNGVYDYMRIVDVFNGIFKSLVFSTIIAHMACFHGYFVRGGAAQVGQAANRAVVISLIAVLAANYVVTSWLYGAAANGMSRF